MVCAVVLASLSVVQTVTDTTRNALTKAEVLLERVTQLEAQLDRAEAVNRRVFRKLKKHKHKSVRVCCDSIVQLGKRIQKFRFRVAEHSAFGGVAPVHSGRAHYEDRALDVNAAPGESTYEKARLSWLYTELQAIPGVSLVLYPGNDPVGHGDHLHLEWEE